MQADVKDKIKRSDSDGPTVPSKSDIDSITEFTLEDVDPQLIIYNRVPKTGSTTLKYLFHKMAVKNDWTMWSSRIYDKFVLNYTMQVSLRITLI